MVTASGDTAKYRTHITNGTDSAWADATSDKGGAGAGFRPHDLLEAALAACVNMTVRMYAAHHGLPLEAAVVKVELDRSDAAKAAFRYSVELQGAELTDEMRESLMRAAAACPVRRTLSRSIEFAAC